jgi:single-stranded DNA-binding protein
MGKFLLSVSRTYMNPKTQEECTEYMLIDVVAWSKLSEICNTVHKGDMVHVEGQLKQETWVDKTTNIKRYKHIINATNIIAIQDVNIPDEHKKNDALSEKEIAIKKVFQSERVKDGVDLPDELPF